MPTAADFKRLARKLGVTPLRVRKIGFIRARRVEARERIVTWWNGAETGNDARPGDYVATNLSTEGRVLRDDDGHANTYVIRAGRFAELYEPTGRRTRWGAIYRARVVVQAIRLDQGFDILAPWGERQTAHRGYLILNGNDVYGNHADTFEATYEVLR